MKKFLYIIFVLFFININANAIEWVNLVSPNGRAVALDKDSILEKEGYYFYNIKFTQNGYSNPIVITMQSGVSHPFSARIKAYSEDEYNGLNGDYNNIMSNKTNKLEPVTYDSIVNTCYKTVKEIKHPVSSNLIILN